MRWLKAVLVGLIALVIVLFIVDKLVIGGPPRSSPALATALAHFEKRDVRRVTIPARTVQVELNDGSTISVPVSNDRDLGPIIRRSGADVTLVGADTDTPLAAYAFQTIPFIVMAVLLFFILRIAGWRSHIR
jgi:ATP-dependent Zn protease